jgi:hypothetical protein
MEDIVLISTIINIAKSVEKNIEKKFENGLEKREELYRILKNIIGEEKFNNNKQVIDFILETAIFISKVDKISGLNEVPFSYCCLKGFI